MFAGLLKKLRAALFIAIASATILGAVPANAMAVIVRHTYIVTIKEGSNAEVRDRIATVGESAHDELSEVLDGFVLDMTDTEVLALQADTNVLRVEQDQPMSLSDTQSPTPSWGLDRIDQATSTGDNSYAYPSTAGAGVNIYIVDTGVMASNPDFAGRVKTGYDVLGQNLQGADCNGHGTHVAGTAAGTKYGVAKKANIIPVRVLSCSGTGFWSDFIAGLDWIVKNNPVGTPAVVSASIGGGKVQSVNDAVENLYKAGITPVIAAGNSADDACNYSPASAPDAITVGASDETDARAYFSNWGNCVDVFAPGTNIISDNYLDPTTGRTLSGTSMATPHVSGLAALYLAGHPTSTPDQVTAAIKAGALSGVVTNSQTASNLLINDTFVKSALPPVGSPTNLAVSSVTTTGALVSWSAPTGTQAAQSYNVEYKAATATTWTLVNTLATQMTLTGLVANTNYSVRVSSVNGTTVSAPSAESLFTTLGVAPSAPTNFRTTSIFGNQATVAWDAPNGNGSVITSYNVYFMTGTTKSAAKVTSSTSITLTGLTPTTSYTIAVESRNANGVSPLSANFTFTTAVASPGQVSRISFSNITANSATASWTALPVVTAGVPITYSVATYLYTSLGWIARPVYTTTDTTLNLAGLTRYASQGLIITAYSGSVAGPASLLWSFNTLATVPSVVTSFTISRIAGTNTSTLAWLPPSDNGGSALTGYQLDKFDGANWIPVATLGSTTQSYAVTLPARGVTDTYRISALNALGAGPAKTLTATLSNTAPLAPTGLTATQSSDKKSVTLTWVAPTDDGGAQISGYRVYYGNSSTALNYAVAANGANTLSYTMTIPFIGTATYFGVVAVNSVGLGQMSSLVSVTRTASVPTVTTAPTASWNTDGSLKLSWSAPADNGGSAITGYTVQRLEAGVWVNKFTGNVNTTNFTREAPGTTWQYRIIATNAIGDSQPGPATGTILVPYVAASAPQNLTVVDNGSAAVLTWIAPVSFGGGTIGYYGLQVSRDNGATWVLVANVASLGYTTSRPAKGSTWLYRVYAVNQAGVGAVSATVSLTVAATVPGATSSTAAFANDGSINLNWYPSSDNGGSPLTGFKVEKSYDQTTWATILNAPANQVTLNVPRENPGVRAYFRVSATNAVGIGVANLCSIQVPYLKASAPQNVVFTNTGSLVTATYAAPANLGGSPTVSYYIQQSKDGGATWVTYTSTSTAMTLSAPRPAKGATISYRVIASTAAGYSDPSQVFTLSTPQTVSSAPSVSGFGFNTDRSITATWYTASDNGGSPVTGYRYQTSVDGTNWSASTDLPSTALSVVMPAVAPGVRLYFHVAQLNAIGASAYSSTVSLLNPQVLAQAPNNLGLSVSGQYVTATWTVPGYLGGATSATYYVYTSTDGVNFLQKAATTGMSATIAGFAKGSSVWVRVAAVNTAGIGPFVAGSAQIPTTVTSGITSLVVTRASATSLAFAFSAPTDLGGANAWSFKLQMLQGSTWVTVATGSGSSTNTVTIAQPLSTSILYFRVLATNPNGDSTSYNLVSIR